MAKLSKLQKFAAIRTFPNVYSSEAYDSNLVIDHQGEAIDIKGKWQEHFGNDHPIILEVACGKGHYACGLGARHPDKNYIGVELKGNRLYTGAQNALQQGLDNVAFLRARIEFIEFYFAKGEVSEIWITFPDPQLGKPKKRTTAPRFLEVYRAIMGADNLVHLKTDSPDLYAYTLEVLEEQKIDILYQKDDIYAEPLDYPELEIKTFYEEMHLEKGRTIKYVRFSV